MTDLSPAAQAVLDTMHRSYDHEPTRRALAAGVLRAAADQVVPEYKTTTGGSKIWPSEPVLSIRNELLAIATELEGASAQ